MAPEQKYENPSSIGRNSVSKKKAKYKRQCWIKVHKCTKDKYTVQQD
jgi:hypothetical protein